MGTEAADVVRLISIGEAQKTKDVKKTFQLNVGALALDNLQTLHAGGVTLTLPMSAREAIRHASAWPGEIHFIQVFHPWEEKPEVEGEIELLDVETREERRLWFTPRDRERYEARFQEFLTDIESSCQSRQIDYQRWRTDTPFHELFLDLLSRGSALAGSS